MLVDELLESLQLVAIPGNSTRAVVPVDLHPLKELVDGLGERDGGLGASHPAILLRNILKSTFSSVSSIRSHRTHVRGRSALSTNWLSPSRNISARTMPHALMCLSATDHSEAQLHVAEYSDTAVAVACVVSQSA